MTTVTVLRNTHHNTCTENYPVVSYSYYKSTIILHANTYNAHMKCTHNTTIDISYTIIGGDINAIIGDLAKAFDLVQYHDFEISISVKKIFSTSQQSHKNDPTRSVLV